MTEMRVWKWNQTTGMRITKTCGGKRKREVRLAGCEAPWTA
jgi:hypothetical protein